MPASRFVDDRLGFCVGVELVLPWLRITSNHAALAWVDQSFGIPCVT